MTVTSIVAGSTAAVGATQVAAVLGAARSVVLVAHQNPDADALGSALALGLALEARGVEVIVCFDTPAVVPVSLSRLPGQHLIATSDLDVSSSPDLVVTVDVASANRMGRFETLLRTAGSSVVVDHHASNPGFGELNWIEPAAEATVVLVTEILDVMGVAVEDRRIATNLYAGLVTDTGHFRWSSPAGHRLAARLLESGIDAGEILRPITDTHPFGWLAMLAAVLRGSELHPAVCGAGLVLAAITLEQSAGMRQEELDAVIDIVRTTGEAQIAAVLKQAGTELWQVSLRSRSTERGAAPDVGAVATDLGGGGHRRAAGYTTAGTYEQVVASLIHRLDRR